MVPEAPLRKSRNGLVTDGEGWFVVNARESRWGDEGRAGLPRSRWVKYRPNWLPGD